MINPEDLRIGDLVRLGRDCIFPKGTMCTVADIRTEIEHKDKNHFHLLQEHQAMVQVYDLEFLVLQQHLE